MWHDTPPIVRFEKIKKGTWRPRIFHCAYVNDICIGEYPKVKEAKAAVESRLRSIKEHLESLGEEYD